VAVVEVAGVVDIAAVVVAGIAGLVQVPVQDMAEVEAADTLIKCSELYLFLP
jgi:hypothetical protein